MTPFSIISIGDLIVGRLKKCFRVLMMLNILILYMDGLRCVINVQGVNFSLKRTNKGLKLWVSKEQVDYLWICSFED
jgi:hypothetical protein